MSQNTLADVTTQAWGKLSATTYTLPALDGGLFTLTHLQAEQPASHAPVICLPGMFTSRHFWASTKGVGLAAYLVDQGHDLWLVERRRIGAAPKQCPGRAGLAEHVLHDLPLVQTFVQQRNAKKAFWMGHSFGGVCAALAVSGRLDANQIAGLVLFATQFEVGKKPLARPFSYLTRLLVLLLGRLPGKWVGLGPENEPRAAVQDACRWVQLAQGKDQRMQRALSAIDLPVLAMVGAGDTVDPPEGCRKFISHMPSTDKTFVEAGQHSGFSIDFGHPQIVISKQAQREIWPALLQWLEQHAPDDLLPVSEV